MFIPDDDNLSTPHACVCHWAMYEVLSSAQERRGMAASANMMLIGNDRTLVQSVMPVSILLLHLIYSQFTLMETILLKFSSGTWRVR